MRYYEKLVRDRIPELISAAGEVPVTRVLDLEEYLRCLEDKLDEETGEYHRDKNAEELADILEVVFALADALGYDKQQMLSLCEEKRMARGGFDGRIYLIGKE